MFIKKSSMFVVFLLILLLNIVYSNNIENGLIITDAKIIENRYLNINFEDNTSSFDNTELVLFYVISDFEISEGIFENDAKKFMYDLKQIKEHNSNRQEFISAFNLDKRYSDSYGLMIFKSIQDNEDTIEIDLNCTIDCEEADGFEATNKLTEKPQNIYLFLARYDLGRNLFTREYLSSVVDKDNLSEDTGKYTSNLLGKKFIKKQFMFDSENLESTKYNYYFSFESQDNEESDLAIAPKAEKGIEGELEKLQPKDYSDTQETEEVGDIMTPDFSLTSTASNNTSFNFNSANYKNYKAPSYSLPDNITIKKRIYSFNQGQTLVLKNTIEEKAKDKTLDLILNLDKSTSTIYLIIDSPQSKPIPSMTQFVISNSSIIEVKSAQTRYLKIDKSILKNNKITLNLKYNADNVSLQLIEIDNANIARGIYSTNVLQLDELNFNKYAQFQINKNLIEFYCPECKINDYGINNNGFGSCGQMGKSKFLKIERLREKQNTCLLPDGSRISGFTKEALEIFGFDKLYFDWGNDNIYSSIFDYGEYYIDQEQFRIAVSTKLNEVANKNYILLSGTKYKKGKNNLVSKVSVYKEYDLNSYTSIMPFSSVDSSFNSSIVVLNLIPKEYQKLTIIDLVNNEPTVTDSDFEKALSEILKTSDDYYKYKDYHTHFQITLEKYLSSITDFKNYSFPAYSDLLYGTYTNTKGHFSVYFSEGLDYFIYNIKPFKDMTGETSNILGGKYSQFLKDYWKIKLLNTTDINTPQTVLIQIKNSTPSSKEATLEIYNSALDLSLNDYNNNQQYSLNPLFLHSFNPTSHISDLDLLTNRDFLSSPRSNIDGYSSLQNGKLIDFNLSEPEYKIYFTEPVIFKKELSDNVIVKYYNGTEYTRYPQELISVIDSTEDFPITETIVIYPPITENNLYPLIIESESGLFFNKEDINYTIINDKYNYSLIIKRNYFSLEDLINGISKGENCFSFNGTQFSVWENIDEQLTYAKSRSYEDFKFAFPDNSTEAIPTTTQVQPTTDFAIYVQDDSKNILNNQIAVASFVKTETETKNIDVLKNYNLAYKELFKSEPSLNKNFIDLLNCNETLICQVSKTKHTPTDLFYERYKTECIPNTPTECVKKYWTNPKTNYCAAFVKNFNSNYFGYNFDSANAWDLANQANNKSIWKATEDSLSESEFDNLIPGSILGIKHNNTSYTDKTYSHVITYLGKIGTNHYIIHSWGNTLKIEQLDVFLKTTAKGKNQFNVYEDGKIMEVLISSNLYSKIKTKAKEKTIFLGEVNSFDNEVVPDYIFDNYSAFQLVSSFSQTSVINTQMYSELEDVYNRILEKNFDVYYKENYVTEDNPELKETIKLDLTEPMIIILGKYKKMFLVNKENNQTNIIGQYPISTGVNGFGCKTDSLKTPIGLFKIVQKVGQRCLPFQIIGASGCEFNNNKPVIASYNSGLAYVVTRKLVIDGLEKDNIGLSCENGNRNTIYRGIYIHGTNMEQSMGQQRSHGCIRMLNNDVIALFDMVKTGTYVYVYNSETSYSQLLDLENKLATESNGAESLLAKAKTVKTKPSPKKTMTDVDNYINNKINQIKLLDLNTTTDLTYVSHCNKLNNLKLNCAINSAIDVEYDSHVINPQSAEFNYIVFKVTKAFNFSLEETAQFWGGVAQESGTSTNISGTQKKYGKSLTGKPAYGIAQIEYIWFKYEANKYTYDLMVPYFENADLSSVIAQEKKISEVTKLTGNANTVDSREEIIALLKLIKTNKSKYASVIFSAGLKSYLANRNIEGSKEYFDGNRTTGFPFTSASIKTYDHADSINIAIAVIYNYKYTSTKTMFNGIKKYRPSDLTDTTNTIKTIVLKLANYLAFKKEYYMYKNGMIDATHSDLLASMKNAKVI